MKIYTYFRRGLWQTICAESSTQALDLLRAEVGSTWGDWQLTGVADLTWQTLPAQKVS